MTFTHILQKYVIIKKGDKMNNIEVNFKLENNYEKYFQLLNAHNIPNTLIIKKHDIYWTKSDLGDKTEEEIEPLCTILRTSKVIGGTNHKEKKFLGLINNDEKCKMWYENLDTAGFNKKDAKLFDGVFTSEKVKLQTIDIINSRGYRKVFDLNYIEYQFTIPTSKAIIKLKKYDNLGLICTFSNSNLSTLPADMQKNRLIEDLSNYGINVTYNSKQIEVLRTLYFNKEMYK